MSERDGISQHYEFRVNGRLHSFILFQIQRSFVSAFLFCTSGFSKPKSNLLLKEVQLWDQTRLLRTLFSWVFKMSKVHLYCLVKWVIYG